MTTSATTELTNAELTAKLALMESRLELLRDTCIDLAEDIDGTHDRVDSAKTALLAVADWMEAIEGE
ncbi:hypothetical protein CH254_02325 [Rhodococcus sp. 06-412-2C]|uniref:hypothetical protein n=1 Tax=unclassified Rhodococcus (in: high G+C Gram-positive bacteria) TaxID=192944 RepID=UPI000B9A2AE5|nr:MULTISPECIES: hypothetical protein [unclassified Rhodococcus (in: high G+C Gram-positive bacteria)]OZC93484.1 hypothetical protein CH254_02325 [Rhodococcus sp. 06-412-2C]OZC95264.1 hypothetical protein CH279_18655 [Rhodococcus sp. 06-412-2B]